MYQNILSKELKLSTIDRAHAASTHACAQRIPSWPNHRILESGIVVVFVWEHFPSIVCECVCCVSGFVFRVKSKQQEGLSFTINDFFLSLFIYLILFVVTSIIDKAYSMSGNVFVVFSAMIIVKSLLTSQWIMESLLLFSLLEFLSFNFSFLICLLLYLIILTWFFVRILFLIIIWHLLSVFVHVIFLYHEWKIRFFFGLPGRNKWCLIVVWGLFC